MAVIKRDSISTIYKELFTIKFLHNGYGFSQHNTIDTNIKIEPDDATKYLFKRHSIDFRFSNDQLICFIRAKLQSTAIVEPKLPFIKFSGNVRIRFLLNASIDFFSKSDVLITGAKQVYYFTNKVNAASGGFICLKTTGVGIDDLKSAEILNLNENYFSVIDIFNKDAVNSSYDLYDGNIAQKLKSPEYSIRFKSKI
jgi:hypothetical protein